ncbi:hypothetical protein BSB_00170 [Bacillus stercoris]|nr:hypothetical protein BSB_00170 [Bacillus stercoris]GEK23634.1 hypothetical protein BSU04nite_00230 [Bacillus spizizenii]
MKNTLHLYCNLKMCLIEYNLFYCEEDLTLRHCATGCILGGETHAKH